MAETPCGSRDGPRTVNQTGYFVAQPEPGRRAISMLMTCRTIAPRKRRSAGEAPGTRRHSDVQGSHSAAGPRIGVLSIGAPAKDYAVAAVTSQRPLPARPKFLARVATLTADPSHVLAVTPMGCMSFFELGRHRTNDGTNSTPDSPSEASKAPAASHFHAADDK